MIKNISVYDKETGLIVSKLVLDDAQLAVNTPEGHSTIEGHFDYLSQRVDIEKLALINSLHPEDDAERIAELKTELVIDYQPPSPGDDHEWDIKSKRHLKKPHVIARELTIEKAQRELVELERSSIHAIRKAFLKPHDLLAQSHLERIEARITELENIISG